MAKGVLDRFNVAAKRRLKRLQAAAAQAAGGILEMSYRDTAEQSLRGAAAVTSLMHDEMRDIEKANSATKRKARQKTKRKVAPKTIAKKSMKPAQTSKAAGKKAPSTRAKSDTARKRRLSDRPV